ncbi:hypothetical protein [Caulobacter sp. Root655]|uniref:hypothetical protein n=1 Tax=Caulobacter sp. Root655 TaxID=1736578 RepID=UPI0009E8A9B0|nr:hypothetical protein [Caulobacter sp. Root655]
MSKPSLPTDDGVTSLAAHRMALVVQKARQIRDASDAFIRDWPTLEVRPPMPAFAWPELERQLLDLAPKELGPIVRDLVSAVRKEALPKPPEMVLREILVIAATVLDEDFRLSLAQTPGEGSPMP